VSTVHSPPAGWRSRPALIMVAVGVVATLVWVPLGVAAWVAVSLLLWRSGHRRLAVVAGVIAAYFLLAMLGGALATGHGGFGPAPTPTPPPHS
jgi:hypothetical protein